MAAQAGWLTKKGGIRKNWLRRWFELSTEGELVYYASEDKKDQKGSIQLWQSTDVRESTAPEAATEIEIETPARTWRVKAETEAELTVWLQALQQSAEAAREQRAAAVAEQNIATAGDGPDRVLQATRWNQAANAASDDLTQQTKLMLSRGFLPWDGIAALGSANHQLYQVVSESPDLARQIRDYCIVSGEVYYGFSDPRPDELTPKVTELVRLGWQPHGGLAAAGEGRGYLYQAMILPTSRETVARVAEYKVVGASQETDSFADELGASVTTLLKSGWRVIGGIAARGKNMAHLYQALVRHEEVEEDVACTGSEQYCVASFRVGSMLPSGVVDPRDETEGLADEVASLIADGWQLVGGVNTVGE
jgi:hypothetical protein|eukprot:COSAG02_NODE_2137_length_9694_cov_51.871287_4_plen_365_part_00